MVTYIGLSDNDKEKSVQAEGLETLDDFADFDEEDSDITCCILIQDGNTSHNADVTLHIHEEGGDKTFLAISGYLWHFLLSVKLYILGMLMYPSLR